MEKQEDTHDEKKRIDDSTRAQQSHTGCAVSSTCTSFVQCSLSTKAAALSPCWAWKPVSHSVSQDAGDQSVTFSNTISFQDNFSFVQFLFLMPQLKNASKHSGKFWMIALILGGFSCLTTLVPCAVVQAACAVCNAVVQLWVSTDLQTGSLQPCQECCFGQNVILK